ncbi:MAG: hypothetical protein IKD31_06260 [Clostridia bacterium]|nr:hypothetical protein [Clostridia bacterium]
MSVRVAFGIDTSNYTTSAAAVTAAGEVFYAKRPLFVPQGECGMRQSDALFCHTRDLPEVVEECLSALRNAVGSVRIEAVGVSSTPRRAEGSYMPCFLAGVNAAASAAQLLGVPLFRFSHQEGHIEAARFGSAREGRVLSATEFLAFHLSGGTTELLLVREVDARYDVRLLADTLDLTCGQLIDRCGVALGTPFPAGVHLERLALARQDRKRRIPIKKKETGINLSGFENRFRQKMEAGETAEDLAGFVFDVTASAVESLLSFAPEELPVLFSGGVSSSVLLRQSFSGERYFFAPPSYSADNAIGIACLAMKGALLG